MEFDARDDVNTNMGKLFALVNNMNSRAENRHTLLTNELLTSKNEQKLTITSHLELTDSCQFLAGEVQEMNYSLNNFDGKEISNNILIKGVPKVPNEKHEDSGYIISEVLELLSFEMRSEEVVDTYRIGLSGESPTPSILKLINNFTIKFLSTSKRKRRITAASVVKCKKKSAVYKGCSMGGPMISQDEQLYG